MERDTDRTEAPGGLVTTRILMMASGAYESCG